MKWTKGFRFIANYTEPIGGASRDGALRCSRVNKHQMRVVHSGNSNVPATSFQQSNFGYKQIDQEILILARNVLGKCGVSFSKEGDVLASRGHIVTASRSYGKSSGSEPDLDRDFFVKLWVADRKVKRPRTKRRQEVATNSSQVETIPHNQISMENVFGRWFSAKPISEEKSYDEVKPVLEQPPVTQPPTGALSPASIDEVRVAPLLARANLLITRSIEWGNLVLGFEQENRYVVLDVCYPQAPVGFIAEKSNLIARQMFRQRRPFVAYITDALGNELFTVRRPFWWINSSIYTEIGGKEVGVVHRRWHLWRRIYDLYLGNKQFAVVENPGFWNWTFTLKDIDGNVLAQIDRDWRGFGFEIFTDAGQYVIRFGSADGSPTLSPAGEVPELEVVRPLTLSERAIAVALAVSLDNDYFSRHGGWGIPFFTVEE